MRPRPLCLSAKNSGLRRGALLLLATTLAPVLLRAGQPEPVPPAPAPARHSFLDPVGDFVRDDILRPVHPFEMVPGKDADGWSFSLKPYLWLASMAGETGVSPLPAINLDVRSRTILQNLKWGAMGAGEIRKGRWGLIADGIYMTLEGSGDLGGNLYRSGSLEVTQGLASLALAYRVIDDRRGYLDVYAGARYNYLGMDVGLTPDPGGISHLADSFTDRLQNEISETISGFLAGKKDLLISELTGQVQSALTSRRLEQIANPPEELRQVLSREALERLFRPNRGALADYIAAQAAARAAAARGQLTSALQSRVASAKARLSKELARAIEDALPTSGSGDVWWVDPIVGLRGQINLTRWLYLSAQADAGGFGAGSQITWNVLGTVGVNFTRHVFGELGYRYMYVDYDRNGFLYQVATYGFYSSIGVRF